MTFTLTYRQGSFLQSEVFISQIGAVARAYVMLGGIGCSGHQIDEDGKVVLYESEIIAGCEDACRDRLAKSVTGPMFTCSE
jgi:hypothetical protein